jgi:hypothetical protein
MRPEKEQLLHELTADQSRRQATLLSAGSILRQRRHWRYARQTLLLAFLAAVAALFISENSRPPRLASVSRAAAKAAAPAPIQELTDEQLLALFPDTPVGLATLPNGKKLLLFLRPADAAKYSRRL